MTLTCASLCTGGQAVRGAEDRQQVHVLGHLRAHVARLLPILHHALGQRDLPGVWHHKPQGQRRSITSVQRFERTPSHHKRATSQHGMVADGLIRVMPRAGGVEGRSRRAAAVAGGHHGAAPGGRQHAGDGADRCPTHRGAHTAWQKGCSTDLATHGNLFVSAFCMLPFASGVETTLSRCAALGCCCTGEIAAACGLPSGRAASGWRQTASLVSEHARCLKHDTSSCDRHCLDRCH